MKKIKLLVLVMVIGVIATLNGQSLAGKKIMINPGHGGHDSNDREIPLGNGVTFWESEGNLTKGMYLKSILESLGATVIMSRTTNTTADDLDLATIAAIANTNSVDYFHSIHSNATGTATKANYSLILFNGTTSSPTNPKSKEMAGIMAPIFKSVNRTISTMSSGDVTFLGYNLGVLKPLTMPGTLSEGSFHDYTPETWRLKNDSYLKHEAWAIARSFLKYFNAGELKTGIAAGILRDELESVPASYSPLSGTKDNFKPVNGVKVTLMPGAKTYTTDNFNNGYYFFDNLTPGNYKLTFEYPAMKTDTVNIVVNANESVFTDKAMILNPILDPPVIVSSSPQNNLGEVSNITNIVVEFSIRMNTDVTQNAFSLSPAVAGTFKWENDYKKLTFTPSKGFIAGAKHTITISNQAKTYFGVNLPQQYSFSFTTRSKLNLLSTYPVNNATDVSTTLLITLKFEKGIDGSTLGGKISLRNSKGDSLGVSVKKLGNVDGIIEFEPKVPLDNNSLYRLTLKAGIGDVEYVTMPNQVVIDFKTENKYSYTGTVVDGFESFAAWQSPFLASNTKGINSNQTSFVLSDIRKISGDYSGRIDYGFSGSNGAVELAMINPVALGESSSAEFGMWIFGDNSYNTFEYHFVRANEEKVHVDTLNWTGWKFKKIQLNKIPGSGTIKFKSIVIVQSSKGGLTGKLFLDDCIGNVITDVRSDNLIPSEFSLQQNYPNPFNPSTKIRYSIPAGSIGQNSKVTLKIYDMLGKEITTLVNEVKAPGNYEATFNGSGLASGVYLYRLESQNFSATKKLILLK